MASEQIINDWKRGAFHPIYWLDGEEPYYIDQVTDYAEHHLLSAEETSFNLSVFYGKDTKVEDLINACKRYPMFSERQVVILKEAQQLKDIDKLETYVNHPLSSTILVIAHKEKKLDGRSKLSKILKTKAHVMSTRKLYDNELPDWTLGMVNRKGFDVDAKAVHMLVEHIGNDLNRLENEVDKLSLNMQGRKKITEDDIETYIGISKEFNAFEFQAALAKKDLQKCLQIISYFSSNPKAGPIQLILPTLYSFFSKMYIVSALPSRDEYAVSSALGVKPFFAKQYMQALQLYPFQEIEKVLLLLHDTNLKSLGMSRADTDDASLLTELVTKVILVFP